MTSKPHFWIVYGTRPEVIKMAPVVRALRARKSLCRYTTIFTGQHRELAADLFESLEMHPDVTFDLMKPDQSPEELGARCLQEVAHALRADAPDCVAVQGDTTTVLFTALAAYFQRIAVAHVEAGLRSHDKYSPFPEEMMRRVADRIADHHFAPTSTAALNLRNEGIPKDCVYVTGNTVVDAVRWLARTAEHEASAAALNWVRDGRPYVVVTLHRRESFGSDLRQVLLAIRDFAANHPHARVIFPVHPNPKVRSAVKEPLEDMPNVSLREPLPYLDMLHLLRHAQAILTDSGGIQEEAPALGKRVLVARRVTERPEGVRAGVAELVGADRATIVHALTREMAHPAAGSDQTSKETPYGDGMAGERIADILLSVFCGRRRETSDWQQELDQGALSPKPLHP